MDADRADRETAMMDALRSVVATFDPVPDDVREAARNAFAFRNFDIELAQLVFDSAVDGLVGVRGDVGRQLTFRGAGRTIEVEILGSVAMRLVGQLVPAEPCLIEVVQDATTKLAVADGLGRFECDGLAPGRMTLRCTDRDGGAVVQTVSTPI
jgi:hypothetical protein